MTHHHRADHHHFGRRWTFRRTALAIFLGVGAVLGFASAAHHWRMHSLHGHLGSSAHQRIAEICAEAAIRVERERGADVQAP